MKGRVVVGMSGGVDSSVAALLLKQTGYEVIGLFMNNWDEQDDSGACTSAEDFEDARSVCTAIGIPLYSVSFAKEYYDRVFSYFLGEYAAGRTPNPDVLCNREIKFAPFKRKAAELGAQYVATGHYCRIDHASAPVLLKAADASKDQTYFLNQVRTEQLENVLFPIGGMLKKDVRAIAVKNGLVTGRKKDSTGICFIGERNFRSFLAQYLPARPGDVVDVSGRTVGRHNGVMYYTLGQRRGLGIGGVSGAEENRWYVVDKDVASNRLIVSCGEGEELMSDGCECSGLNIIGDFDWRDGSELRCCARMRYRQPDQPVTAVRHGDGFRLTFGIRQRAVTPGQYAVLYSGERCIGGGVIVSAFRS